MNAAVVSSQLTGNSNGATISGSAGNRNPVESNSIGAICQIQFPSAFNFSRSYDGTGYNGTGHSGFVGKVIAICKFLSFSDLFCKSSRNFRSIGVVAAFGSNVQPSVLHLSSTLVLTDDTDNGDGVANRRLSFHLIKTNRTVCRVETVEVEGVAISILNGHVAVSVELCSIVLIGIDRNDLTGNNVLVSGVYVVALCQADGVSTNERKLGVFSRSVNEPAVLHLCLVIVLTEDTVNGDGVANLGLSFHLIKTNSTVCRVETVEVEGVAVSILNGHVTIGVEFCSIILIGIDRKNGTGNKVLAFGVGVVTHQNTHLVCLFQINKSICIGEVGKGYCEFLRIFSIAALCGNSDDDFSICFGNGNGELAISNNCSSVVGSPGEGNVSIGSVCCGELDNGVLVVDGAENLQSAKSGFNLLCRSLFNSCAVGECIGGNGNEVECATVDGDDTGYVSSEALLCSVLCLESICICLGECEGGAGNTQVSFFACQCELEITLIKVLIGDLNALNGNEAGLIFYKIRILHVGCFLEEFGVVHRSYRSLLLGNDSNLQCAIVGLDFVSAVVDILNTAGNTNGHTDLDAKVSNRISVIRHTVNVVSTAGCILQEQAVVACANRLGNDTGYNALNLRDEGIFLCSDVFVPSHQTEYGNDQVLKYLGLSSGVVACSNGSSQVILYFFRRFFINIDDNFTVFSFTNGYLIGVNAPSNGIGEAADHNLRNNLIVDCSLGVCLECIFVKRFEVNDCAVDVISLLSGSLVGVGSCGGCGLFILLVEVTGCESCEHEDKYQCKA